MQRLAAVEQLRQLCVANEIDLFYIENENNPIKVAKEAQTQDTAPQNQNEMTENAETKTGKAASNNAKTT